MAQGFVVHSKRSAYDVYIGRPSKWGNPFAIGVGPDGQVREYRGRRAKPT